VAACILIAACAAGGKPTAKVTAARLVSQAVTASGAVDSGRIALTLTLNLDGIKQLAGEPVTLDVSGPFQRDQTGEISADLTASVEAAGNTANIELVLLPGHTYLGIGGAFYDLPRPAGEDAQGASGPSGPSGGILGTLGIDPHGWLTDLHDVGAADVGGVKTEHVSAHVDVASLLGATGAGAVGSTGPSGLAGLAPLLEQAITSAKADVYTGIDDHIVRRFDLAVSFTVPALAAGAVDGLSGGTLDLVTTLTDLGRPQTIMPPANAQPRSHLLNGIFDLESKFGSLAPLFAGSGGNFGGLFSPGHPASS
jgi:hypothetical protein